MSLDGAVGLEVGEAHDLTSDGGDDRDDARSGEHVTGARSVVGVGGPTLVGAEVEHRVEIVLCEFSELDGTLHPPSMVATGSDVAGRLLGSDLVTGDHSLSFAPGDARRRERLSRRVRGRLSKGPLAIVARICRWYLERSAEDRAPTRDLPGLGGRAVAVATSHDPYGVDDHRGAPVLLHPCARVVESRVTRDWWASPPPP